jgi:hypothetical protein
MPGNGELTGAEAPATAGGECSFQIVSYPPANFLRRRAVETGLRAVPAPQGLKSQRDAV